MDTIMKTKNYFNLQSLILRSLVILMTVLQAPMFAHTVRVWNRTGEKLEVAVKLDGAAVRKHAITPDQTYIDFDTGALCLNHVQVTGLSGKIEGKISEQVAGDETGFAISCKSNHFVAERIGDQLILRRMLDTKEPSNYYTKWYDLVQDDQGNYMWAYKIAEERDKWATAQQYIYSEEYLAAVQALCSKIPADSKYPIPCK
jgi:hypothetical protein